AVHQIPDHVPGDHIWGRVHHRTTTHYAMSVMGGRRRGDGLPPVTRVVSHREPDLIDQGIGAADRRRFETIAPITWCSVRWCATFLCGCRTTLPLGHWARLTLLRPEALLLV